MRLLLDTHVLLWWLAGDPTLSRRAMESISNEDNFVGVSAVTAWEIAIKRSIGKLRAPNDLEEQLEANAFVSIPITVSDGLNAGGLDRHHDDPFDRMLVAQAQTRGLTIVTRDSLFTAYGVDILLA